MAVRGVVRDPRTIQIAAQSTFLALETVWLDFGPSLPQAATFILTALALDLARARLLRTPVNWKSALSTGLSLSLLPRTEVPLLWVAAAIRAMGSKFLIHFHGKHLFNPSAFAIMALLLGRAWYLGDPWAIPLHRIQSGGLLIFALFMITNPRSTPNSRTGRMLFAAAIAVLAHAFLFRLQVWEGVFYPLVLVSCFTPIIDRIWPGQQFARPQTEGECAPPSGLCPTPSRRPCHSARPPARFAAFTSRRAIRRWSTRHPALCWPTTGPRHA